ncbi:helix-turn-helix domain-containing protein [Pseudobythopirellula maris]|uniref:helix-turn-helix domain-containing protein n=1 Tax=Pseudobythopirellula maris TaxID=2527991 RepID=UPI00370468ED
MDPSKFGQWERDIESGHQSSEYAVCLEVQARLLRVARDVASTHGGSPPSAKLSRADELACHITKNYQGPLTASSIAEAVGVHQNYAMNLFQEAFGMTMTSFITQHRISHAQRMLVTTDERILGIALEAGFQSLSRFNEAFKAACKCSPRDYRKAHRIERPS